MKEKEFQKDLEPIRERYLELAKRYQSYGASYNNLTNLQDLRMELTLLFGRIVPFIASAKYSKVFSEHNRHSVLACLIIEESVRDPKISQSKADSLARCSDQYTNYLVEMSNYNSDWDEVSYLAESIKQLLFSVSGHISILNNEKY